MTALATVNPFYAARFHRVARAAPLSPKAARSRSVRSTPSCRSRPGTPARCRT